MLKILNKLKNTNDERQEWKVKHKLMNIVAIVLFATIANPMNGEKLKILHMQTKNFCENI
jgi:hypothetical protein